MTDVATKTNSRGVGHLPADVSFFFVTGAHKSGTNWVGAMLRVHPELFLTGEAWFVGYECSVETWIDRERFDRWCGIPTVRSRWTKDLDLDRVRVDVQRAMIETVMRQRWRPGIKAIGDRTPLFYLRDVEFLHSMFPEVVLINIMRDGRDVAVSHQYQLLRNKEWRFFDDEDIEQGKKSREYFIEKTGDPQPLFTEFTLRDLAKKWVMCVEGARRARLLYGNRFIEFRYEQLKQDPSVIASALEAIGVDSSAERVQECVKNGDFEKLTGRQPGQESPGDFFRKGMAGEWLKHFTDRDKAIYKEIAGPTLIEEGYADDLNW